jgi:ADP-heptose:LPS heptosyltransferase
MYKVEALTNFLATEPIVEEVPIVPQDIEGINSVLVVMNQGLGDHLLILPLLRILKKKYSRVAVFCHKGYSIVFEDVVNKIIPFGGEKEDSYDLVINLNPSNDKLEEAIYMFNPKIKIGLKSQNPKYEYDILVEDYLVSRAIHYLNFLKILNIQVDVADFKINLKANQEILGKFGINSDKKIISLCVGSSDQSKCLDPLKYGQLATELIDKGYQVVLLGRSILINENGVGGLITGSENRIINLIDKTKLEDVMQIINASSLVISNDNGLMHLAAALNKQMIALFGVTNPQIWGPNSDKAIVLNVTKDNCDKIKTDYCRNENCIGCIDKIEVSDILNLIKL